MKKGTFISLLVALIAVAGALIGLVMYLRSRSCLICSGEEADLDDDYMPQSDLDYEADYYVDGQPQTFEEEPAQPAEQPQQPAQAPLTEGDEPAQEEK